MKNITISGLSGFVGKNLGNYLLEKGFAVTQFDRVAAIELGNCHSFIHLAGKAHDTKNTSKPDEYYEANFQLTKKIYDAFLASDACKFIFMSSVKAAADTVEGVLNEKVQANPQTHYGKSKRMAEEYILENLPKDKQVYILRPCMIHGPGNKGNLNLLYKVVKSGLPWPLGAFQNQRSFLSIDNLCFVINELLIREDVPSGIYNVSDAEPISTNTLIRLISEELGHKTRIWSINKTLITNIARVGDTLHLPLNSERLKKLTESYIVDNNKLLSVLGVNLPIDSETGIRKTINSFA